ncbi:hypothetical protein [Paenibacillus polymyxa]|uniref:hypothetical protein n=1 Tax=Paenibacillus polymyxa TaxID=1406 RepID=UPI002023BDDB|nr:hypothetical protein [Paenibacillus polymyxa]WDZ55072.1 hypothetical protein MF622_10240 [Paenibacillus polymyxa]
MMTDTGAMAMRPADTGESKRRQAPKLRGYRFTVDVGLMNPIPRTREQAVSSFLLKLDPAVHPEGMLCKGPNPTTTNKNKKSSF